jgi:hypothetical protein
MAMSTSTTRPAEAQLEARINATVARVFAGVAELRHQLRFKLRLGRTVLDAGVADYVEGRADIIVYQADVALAVLELKREGLPLTKDDEEQGRSYALLAQAPLLVITNGVDTKIFQTHDMVSLAGTTINATEIAKRFEAAAISARAGTSSAISKLLGADLAAPAVAALTAIELEELTGDWVTGERFVRDFLVPRNATNEVKAALRDGKHKIILVSGPPLSGKSSVLREVALKSANEPWDVLYVEGSSCSEGLFRRLANALAVQFSWPASTDESRIWLRQLSSRSERVLVLCLDSLPLASSKLLSELDELLTSFGDQLRIVIAVDENDVDPLVLRPNGRERTRIGRRCARVEVGNYDDEEFEVARRELGALGGGLVYGAQYAPELRAPWVLRAAAATRMQGLPDGETVVLPPLLGPEMFAVADVRFASLGQLRDDLGRLASVYLDDVNSKRQHGDALASMYLFSIRQEVVRQHLERDAIRELLQAGLLRRGKAYSGDVVYLVRVPELFGQELASRLATLLSRRVRKSADEAAKWLISNCSRIPLGDAIGAHAISKSLPEMGASLYLELVNGLLKQPPRKERLAPGSRLVTLLPSVGLVDIEIGKDGTMTLRPRDEGARPVKVEIDEDEDLNTISNMDGWLILSQMREFRLALVDENEELFNVAMPLLLELGTCSEVLRRPGRNLEEFHVHQIDGGEISCFKNGIAEPVTWAISELLVHDIPGVNRDAWVQEAAGSGSAPLVNRLGQALSHISELRHMNAWAQDMLERYYRPALAHLPQFH